MNRCPLRDPAVNWKRLLLSAAQHHSLLSSLEITPTDVLIEQCVWTLPTWPSFRLSQLSWCRPTMGKTKAVDFAWNKWGSSYTTCCVSRRRGQQPLTGEKQWVAKGSNFFWWRGWIWRSLSMAWKLAVPPVCKACRVSLTSGGTWLQSIQVKEHLCRKTWKAITEQQKTATQPAVQQESEVN